MYVGEGGAGATGFCVCATQSTHSVWLFCRKKKKEKRYYASTVSMVWLRLCDIVFYWFCLAVLPEEEKEKKAMFCERARFLWFVWCFRGCLRGWLVGCFICRSACLLRFRVFLFEYLSRLFSKAHVPHHPLPPEIAPPAPLDHLRSKNSPYKTRKEVVRE